VLRTYRPHSGSHGSEDDIVVLLSCDAVGTRRNVSDKHAVFIFRAGYLHSGATVKILGNKPESLSQYSA
jgi:hypothetical protein